jgi:hypothetical protein
MIATTIPTTMRTIMKFSIRALDGSSGRLADKIGFVADKGTTAWAATNNDGFTYRDGDVTSVPSHDVVAAAEQIAHLLYRYGDHSLIVYPTRGTTMRGDELRTADVYPPGHQPRINLEG